MATQPDWYTRERHHGQHDRPVAGSSPSHTHDDDSMFGQVSHVLSHLQESGYVRTLGLAGLAAGLGIAIGLWLGGRRGAKRHESALKKLDVPDVVKLAPVAAQLAANPIVRVYVGRMVWRQIRKYFDDKLDR